MLQVFMRVLFILFLSIFFLPNIANSATSQADTYKFMGSAAGVAEVCYGSMKIPEGLSNATENAVKENPSLEPLLNNLVEYYNEGYYESIASMRIWDNHNQKYSRVMDCDKQGDIDGIKMLENEILNTF